MGTGKREGYCSYEELKERKVVAQGWPDLDDLSQMRDQGLPEQSFVSLLQNVYPEGKPPDEVYRIFKNLLIEIEPGDLVLAFDGTKLMGIGKVEATRYNYTNGYNYAHAIGPVEWVDIEDIRQKTGKRLEIGAGMRGVIGIQNLVKGHEEVKEAWQLFEGWVVTMNQLDSLIKLIDKFLAIILQGPPGTGKTRLAKQIAARLLKIADVEAALSSGTKEHKDFNDARFAPSKRGGGQGAWSIVQFHPSYSYEDFVRGIAIQGGGSTVTYQTARRILDEIAQEALRNPQKKYVLIIDEINRANLAAVLGELIYALEYRNETVHSLYGIPDSSGQLDHTITLPDNLYIIGTMNTADRSIGRIDYAVRRRFIFVPLYPNATVLDWAVKDAGLRDLAKDMFEAVASLFSKDGYLSPEFHADDVQPGHSYFIAKNCEELLDKFVYQVIPLLREYVKDGVLVPQKNVEIKINVRGTDLPLSAPKSPEELLARLREVCPTQVANSAGFEPDRGSEASPEGNSTETALPSAEAAVNEASGDMEPVNRPAELDN